MTTSAERLAFLLASLGADDAARLEATKAPFSNMANKMVGLTATDPAHVLPRWTRSNPDRVKRPQTQTPAVVRRRHANCGCDYPSPNQRGLHGRQDAATCRVGTRGTWRSSKPTRHTPVCARVAT